MLYVCVEVNLTVKIPKNVGSRGKDAEEYGFLKSVTATT